MLVIKLDSNKEYILRVLFNCLIVKILARSGYVCCWCSFFLRKRQRFERGDTRAQVVYTANLNSNVITDNFIFEALYDTIGWMFENGREQG